MRKLVISILMVITLIAIMAVPAMAETSNLTASVTVNTYASVTITDNGDAGLQFGPADPGTSKLAEADSPSVTVSTASENNVDITISLSGTDFSDGDTHSFGIANAYYNTADDSGSASAISTTTTPVGSALTPGVAMDIYHWLSIPANQYAGSYTSTFTYTSSY